MKRRFLCRVMIGVGVANYLAYVALTLLVGGDALHGHIAQGHYFAAADGGFVEVGRVWFEVCRWHAYSLLVTFPLLLWGGFHLTPTPHDPDELVLSRGD